MTVPDYTPELTPVESIGGVWLKRDDLYAVAGVRGGKVRTCWHLARGATGLVTAGSRASPQVNIVAHIAARLGIPCRVHVPTGELSPEVVAARDAGAEVIQHFPGHNVVIVSRAADDARGRPGWKNIPFGMECHEAVRQTANQVRNLPPEAERIVIPVGSGMSLAGVLTGMQRFRITTPVLGVVVGADPTKRLYRYAPAAWRVTATLEPAGVDYHTPKPGRVGPVTLDPIYGGKCLPFVRPGDVLWCVGIRATVDQN